MTPLVANARLYAVTPAVERAWREVLAAAGGAAGVPLVYVEHPAPAPLDELWVRDDLGLAFMCGWPLANLHGDVQPVAAPVPRAGWAGNLPLYRTEFVAAADRDGGPADLLSGRLGWTVEHSWSGFRAVHRHLAKSGAEPAEWIGPLVTPRRVAEAVLSGAIDAGPMDSLWLSLLAAHDPETAARLRVVDATDPAPAPPLVASPGIPAETVTALAAALEGVSADLLAPLGIAGFSAVTRDDYLSLATGGRHRTHEA